MSITASASCRERNVTRPHPAAWKNSAARAENSSIGRSSAFIEPRSLSQVSNASKREPAPAYPASRSASGPPPLAPATRRRSSRSVRCARPISSGASVVVMPTRTISRGRCCLRIDSTQELGLVDYRDAERFRFVEFASGFLAGEKEIRRLGNRAGDSTARGFNRRRRFRSAQRRQSAGDDDGLSAQRSPRYDGTRLGEIDSV